jgi:hypothetical protein
MRQETYGPTDYLVEEVLPALFERLDSCFPEVGWRRHGRGWEAAGADGRRLVCTSPRGFRTDGGEARAFLEYVNGGVPPKGREVVGAARTLASLAGVDPGPLEREMSLEDAARFEAAERRRALVETYASLAHAALMGPRGKYARSYLVETRGFRSEDLDELPLGLYTTAAEVAEQMAACGFSQGELNEIGLLPGREGPGGDGGRSASGAPIPVARGARPDAWPGRVVGTWHDRWGIPESLWALDILRLKGTSGGFPRIDELESFLTAEVEGAAAPAPEVLYLNGTDKGALVAFGLAEALKSRDGRENLVLVEQPIDALYVRSRELPNVAAICGSGEEMTAGRWERLARWGVSGVTLAFANDLKPDGRWPGREGTLAAIESSLGVPHVPSLYVVDPGRLGAAQDVAELTRDARGSVEPLRELLKERVHAFRYRAMALVEKHKPEAEWTDAGKGAALEEALAFDASVSLRDKIPDLDLFFWPEVLSATGAGAEAVKARRDAAREQRGREALRRAYEEMLADAGRMLKTTRLTELKSLLRERVERIGAAERALAAEPVLSVADELLAHEQRVRRLRGADLIGLPQRTLKSLDLATLGLRGLTLLAGSPATGKSALALQLAIDAVRASADACALFLSLEMPRWDVLGRLKCAVAGVEWKTVVFGSVRGAGVETSGIYRPEELIALREADARLHEIGRRIRILDERNFPEPSLDKVLGELTDLKAHTGAKRAIVVVDDIGAWPIPEHEATRAATDADADRFRVGALKSLRDALDGDPVIAVAETRRGGDGATSAFPEVLGPSRAARTADVVLLLRPLTDGELAVAFKTTRERDGRHEVDPQKLSELKESLRGAGKSYAKLEVAKGRDGVLRGVIDVTFWYRKSRFEEGRR